MSNFRMRTAMLAVAGALCAAGLSTAAQKGQFTKLFNGKNLDGWTTVLGDEKADPKKTWLIKDGAIICTGEPNGYILTKKAYKNYVLRLEWRYASSGDSKLPFKLGEKKAKSGNSGVLVHCQEPFKVWPKSIEVQLENASAGSIFPIGPAESKNRVDVKDKAKPVGEWNSYEITCKDGTVSAILNGEDVGKVTGCDPSSGQIALQSEGAEIHFRNIEIKVLD